MSESTVITVDVSENLSLPLNKEHQSLYWARTQVSIHCGVGISNNDSKVYFQHISEDLKHDQSFILTSLRKMINHFPTTLRYFVRSDNASNYKSAEAFDEMQNLSNENYIMLIRIFGVSAIFWCKFLVQFLVDKNHMQTSNCYGRKFTMFFWLYKFFEYQIWWKIYIPVLFFVKYCTTNFTRWQKSKTKQIIWMCEWLC